jgi:serine phosphatase RsbU (regulator of sigma subunit)
MEAIVERNPRILLLEDNMNSIQKISDTLVPAGYELHYSMAGQNLAGMIYEKKFDLVLHSMMADELNGYDVLKLIKGSTMNSEIPIVFITDEDRKNNQMQGLHVSGVDFLKAPFNSEELLTRINNQLTLLKTNKKLEQSREISKSIHYAERIQKSLLPSEEDLKGYFHDHFLINLPLNIVSGDFYWSKKFGNLQLFALADCTGHGVPGAFLSVLGISLLNEICTRSMLTNTSGILRKLRKKLKQTLTVTNEKSSVSDGMDIALILLDSEKMTLQFSGAYSRMFISRQDEIIEIKGDSQPIGFHPVESDFSNHTLQLFEDDVLYLTSDGYVDQFGGERGKKLQYKNYRNLLHKIRKFDLQTQKAFLLKEHMEWKGINEQVDDILMMGIHIK